MTEEGEKTVQPAWNQAAIWTGADFTGLLRILNQNGWRVQPSYLPGCLVDLVFALGNSGLKVLQSLAYRSAVQRVELGEDPLFILGHWRSGTTLLHELMVLDQRHTFPSTYQCFVPDHFLISEGSLKAWSNFTLPSSRPPDRMDVGWDKPQEDEFALCNLGIPSIYATIAFPNHPPQFLEYLELESVPKHERNRWKSTWMEFLKQVYYGRPGRMVLKSPTHTFRMPILLEMFPGAQFIHIVRDPVTVFMSTVRLWKSLFTVHGYQKPRFEALEEFVFTTFTRMHERLEATRHLVPPQNFVEIRYEDLVADMMGTIESIYERLRLGPFESVRPRIEQYMDAHANYRTNRYEPSAEQRTEIFRRWRPFFEKYGYDPEQDQTAKNQTPCHRQSDRSFDHSTDTA